MWKNKLWFLLLLSSCLIQGCSLTNSQFKTSKRFYNSLQDFDKQCITLREASYKVTYERQILFPKTYTNDSLMVNELISSYEENFIARYKKDSLDDALNYIKNYFNEYVSLLPKSVTKKGTNRKALNAIEDYSSYLPFGIGLAIYKTVYDVVDYTGRFIKIPHQRKKFKKYIGKGEKLVRENLNIISNEFSKTSLILQNEKTLIRQNYLLFLQAQQENKNPYDYYSLYNAKFLENYNLVVMTLEMSKNINESIHTINNSYSILYNETRKRQRFKTDIADLSKMNLHLSKNKFFNDKVEEAMK